jgi:TPR repeat protein
MKRVLAVFGGLSVIALFIVILLWHWLTPHKHAVIRRAGKGDVQAMYDMGIAHLSVSGKGIIDPVLDRNPIYWFRLAATNGHTGAMYILADLGIPNEEKAMWLKKGAELGNKACMVELMNGYQSGAYGLPKDIGAFLYWEACISAATRKENGKGSEEIAIEREKGEIRRRRDWNYDGPIRPLP